MAQIHFNNVKISGLSAAVPKTIIENKENVIFNESEILKFISTTGVERFRDGEPCTSDLCFAAAEKLIAELNWDKSEIEMLIFLSQTPDYILPNTAPLLQNRLKLGKSCIAFDMTLGCSGYIYGLSTIASYLSTGAIKKALFLCGDTPTKMVNKRDKTVAMLFGNAGTATAIEFEKGVDSIKFTLGSDGAGFNSIIIPDGGYRNPISNKSLLDIELGEGIIRNNCNVFLDGMDVFSFGINQAPASVKETWTAYNTNDESIDFYVFHQANMMMNEMIRKKLKIAKEKVPYSLTDYGNTSSASIPITMITQMRDELMSKENNLLLCGFGVGLSWGSCILKTNNLIIPEIIQL